jgi:hypothetical protein
LLSFNWIYETQLVHLRDFSKAPFIIALVAMFLVVIRAEGRRLPVLGALGGLLTVVGLGFRSDVSIFLVLMPLVFLIRGIILRDWLRPSTAVILFACVAVVLDNTIMPFSEALGINNYHVLLLGQANAFRVKLGFGDVHQAQLFFYNDKVIYHITKLYAASAGLPDPEFSTRSYDAVGRALFADLAFVTPANILNMAYAACYQSLFAFAEFLSSNTANDLLQQGLLLGSAAAIAWVFGWQGIALLFLCCLLAGLTAVQFSPRHFFHAQVFGLLFLFAPFAAVARWGWSRIVDHLHLRWVSSNEDPAAGSLAKGGMRLVLLVGLFWLAYWIALMPARRFQTWQIGRTLAHLDALSGRELAGTPTGTNGSMRFDINGIEGTSYLRIALAAPGPDCTRLTEVEVKYMPAPAFYNWSFKLKMPDGPVQGVYLPLPRVPENRVDYIRAASNAGCAIRVTKLDLTSKTIPLIWFAGAPSVTPYFVTEAESAIIGSLPY